MKVRDCYTIRTSAFGKKKKKKPYIKPHRFVFSGYFWFGSVLE